MTPDILDFGVARFIDLPAWEATIEALRRRLVTRKPLSFLRCVVRFLTTHLWLQLLLEGTCAHMIAWARLDLMMGPTENLTNHQQLWTDSVERLLLTAEKAPNIEIFGIFSGRSNNGQGGCIREA
jgi:hypothetical protein